ncbi:hypothetical protein SASPL_120048 [Salvia splendens]|uniref:rRNA-processing protein FYV7 n=1 Tax=Salvia splendens TaxID=180675 RepID=A0A8X8ZUW9_SALSN|nr:hypothetical protein SASPL_120048 [Salvia splendens]
MLLVVISFQILGYAAIMCKTVTYKQLASSAEKQREFYRNAKHVKKYKKSINQQGHRSNSFNARELLESEDVADGGDRASQKKMKYKKNARNLKELYEKKHDEQERGRMEKEAMMQAKKTEREAAEARRRALKEKIYKKTRSGQPVMKYKIERMLESIHGSTT